MSYHHLATAERSQIYALKSNGFSLRQISETLKRSVSTISREIRRNMGARGYRYQQADRLAKDRRSFASQTPYKMTETLIRELESYLIEDWSPEQISGRLRVKGIYISHERIYQHIWSDKRRGGMLYKHLRHRGKKYNYKGRHRAGRGSIPDRVDISLRPKVVENKARVGDWEADTIIGKAHKGAIVSLVDRKTKFTLLKLVEGKKAEPVTKAISERLCSLPIEHKTITFDNGKEFAKHKVIEKNTGAKTFFAKPYHSWERGLNEHTNGLVRQYIPKTTQFDTLDDNIIKCIEKQLNNRPRKSLGFKTPLEVMSSYIRKASVALHG